MNSFQRAAFTRTKGKHFDAACSVSELLRGRASSPDASRAQPAASGANYATAVGTLVQIWHRQRLPTSFHPEFPGHTVSDILDFRLSPSCRSTFSHIAESLSSTTSRSCKGSLFANVPPHRHHGESPPALPGSQEIERVRLFGGLQHVKYKNTLRNHNNDLTLPAPGDETPVEQLTQMTGFWKNPATIQPNNFKFKSLSNWAFNIAVGCNHGCRFCYVPSVSTNKLTPQLEKLGVQDADAQWGDYVYLREWDEDKFLRSLQRAEGMSLDGLKPDGNRAVIYCSTTDPYQVIQHPDARMRRKLAKHAEKLVRRSLKNSSGTNPLSTCGS